MIKILVLHKDADFLQLIRRILAVAGLEFIGTTSKDEAIILLQNGSIDLLIMNWMILDSEDWEELYDKMKTNPKLSKIGVIITYSRHPRSRAIWTNGDCYLATPFVVAKLLVDIRKVLENYGKQLPSVEEMRVKFENYRDELKRQYDWSDEKLEQHRKELLRKAGWE